MEPRSQFIFVACQVGTEPLLKAEIAREWPDFRFSFSRPGFVTFKLPEAFRIAADFDLRSVFARTFGMSIGKVRGEDALELAGQAWELVGSRTVDHVHCWQRDSALPGENDFEPGTTVLATEVAAAIAAAAPEATAKLPMNRATRSGEAVLDCVLVEPNEWWIGHHVASSLPSRWPGGVPAIKEPSHEVISRAYYKMAEAIRWSQLPMRGGDLCAEIGSAPGGAAQWLLENGQFVLGVDPAEMDKRILAHRNFAHIRRRVIDVPRKDFRQVRWLFADSSVAPTHTLDSAEGIVTHDSAHVRGMIITLKLLNAELAAEIPSYLERIRSWGFKSVKARQLAFNRREICVCAMRNRAMRRFRRPAKS